VANGGKLVSATEANGSKTFEYRSLRPSWRMDFAIGRYHLTEAPGLRILYLAEDSVGAARVTRAADGCMKMFAEWFGPLRDVPTLTLLEIPDGFGSQADVTTIIQTAAAFQDSTRFHEIYHELSHLWQPDDTDKPSARWNEGLASFLEFLAVERLDGRKVVDSQGDFLVTWLRRKADANPQWREVPMVDYGKEGLTDLSYSVGAIMFDLLHRVAGHGGFAASLRDFYQSHATTGASAAQLEAAFAAHSPVDVHPVFNDWMRTTDWYEVLSHASGIDDVAARYHAPGRPGHTTPGGALGEDDGAKQEASSAGVRAPRSGCASPQADSRCGERPPGRSGSAVERIRRAARPRVSFRPPPEGPWRRP
jgi:aminopeptidase N